jgi:hypothetical protein
VKKGNNSKAKPLSGSRFGLEAALRATADKLRGNLAAAEYKDLSLN